MVNKFINEEYGFRLWPFGGQEVVQVWYQWTGEAGGAGSWRKLL